MVAVCRAGGRATQAAQQLTDAGLSATVMDGGMSAWQREQLPFSTPDGRPGSVA